MDPVTLSIVGILVSAVGVFVSLIYGWGPFRDRYRTQDSPAEAVRPGDTLLKRIQERGSIRVGFFRYPPLIDRSDSSASTVPVGLYPKLMLHVASANNLKVNFTEIHLSECTQAVVSAEVDLVLCVFQTPKRYQEVDFAALLHLVLVTGIVRSNETRIGTPADLLREDVRVVVEKGEIGAEFLEQLGVRLGRRRVIQVESDDYSEIISLVAAGVADVAIVDGASSRRYLAAHPEAALKRAFPRLPLATCPNGVMLPKGEPSLRDWLTDQFRAARESPQLRAEDAGLLEEWEGIIEKLG